MMDSYSTPNAKAGPSLASSSTSSLLAPTLPRHKLQTVQHPPQLEAYETYHRSLTAHVQTLLLAAKGLSHGVGALLYPHGQALGKAPVLPPGPSRNDSDSSSTDLSLVSSGVSSSQPSSSSLPTTATTSITSASIAPSSRADPPARFHTKIQHPPPFARQPSHGFIFQRRGSILSVRSKDSPTSSLPPDLTARPLEPLRPSIEILEPLSAGPVTSIPTVPAATFSSSGAPLVPASPRKSPYLSKSMDDLSVLQNLSPPLQVHAKTREEEQKKAWDSEGYRIWRKRPSFELKLIPRSRNGSASSSNRPEVPSESESFAAAHDSSHPAAAAAAAAPSAVSHHGESASVSAWDLATSQASSSRLAPRSHRAVPMARSLSPTRTQSQAPTSLRDPSEFGSEETGESYETRRLRRLRKHQDALTTRIQSWYVGVLAKVPYGTVDPAPEIPAFVPSPSIAKATMFTSPWIIEQNAGVAQLSISSSPNHRSGLLRSGSPAHGVPSPIMAHTSRSSAVHPQSHPRATSVPPLEAGNKRQLPLDLELAVRLHTIEGLLSAPPPRVTPGGFEADFLLGDRQTIRLGRGTHIQSQDPDVTLRRR